MFNPFRRPEPTPPTPAPLPQPETIWHVPAALATVAASRDVGRLFGFTQTKDVDNLLVDNTRSAATLTVTVNGTVRYIAAGGRVQINQVGPIQAYTLTPNADIAALAVSVFERRFGNGGVEA